MHHATRSMLQSYYYSDCPLVTALFTIVRVYHLLSPIRCQYNVVSNRTDRSRCLKSVTCKHAICTKILLVSTPLINLRPSGVLVQPYNINTVYLHGKFTLFLNCSEGSLPRSSFIPATNTKPCLIMYLTPG